jgi:predicted Ser/Thr protein kinase
MENLGDLQNRGIKLETLIKLSDSIRYGKGRVPINFNDFLYSASQEPSHVFRDIFQLFDDMVHHYVIQEKKSAEDVQTGFESYDTNNLFVTGCDNPFFADRIFSNRFMRVVKSFRKGIQNNRIYLFEGPPGSGKSTFLNNLLQKFQEYTSMPEGRMYKTYWRLDIEKLDKFKNFKKHLVEAAEKSNNIEVLNKLKKGELLRKTLDFSCPNHDHPILQIPVEYRKEFLDELIQNEWFKEQLFNSQQYRWVLKDISCPICNSITTLLMDTIGDPMEVFGMLFARTTKFDRQFGEGVSIFNPGDPTPKEPINNPKLQALINDLFNTDDIKFIYSYLALTNNGIFALMDIKENNIQRLMSLHGIVSDGVHRVELMEERIKTLFVGLVNPEDKKHYDEVKSFQDRITTIHVPYVLDYKTEVEIYINKFGVKISEKFLPRVLENFAKIIISTRLEKKSDIINEWLKRTDKYKKYIDGDLLLLKMDIYSGKTPSYLIEEDLISFTDEVKQKIFEESKKEGIFGFSGRKSLNVFDLFITKNGKNDNLITMETVKEFFIPKDVERDPMISESFIESLVRLYDFNILQEIKEAIYYYNKEQISRDIKNYLFAINFDINEKVKSIYTDDTIEITEDYFKNFEALYLGVVSTSMQRASFRRDIHQKYISKTLSQEIKVFGKHIEETEQFNELFEKYTKSLKENALAPYMNNENFRRAIIDYNTGGFKTYDSKLRRDIKMMINNLVKNFNYTLEGAKQVCIYALDKNLVSQFG